MQLPTEDRYLMSRQELMEKIDVLLGGRAAEMIVFGDVTTGAHNDLQKATDIARSMVAMYGMTDELGAVSYKSYPNPYLQRSGMPIEKEFSEETAKMIDTQVRWIIDERLDQVVDTLKSHEELLHQVARRLLEKETIEGEDLRELTDADVLRRRAAQ